MATGAELKRGREGRGRAGGRSSEAGRREARGKVREDRERGKE